MERQTLTQRFTEERVLALTEQRTTLLAEAAADKASSLAELRTVLEAAAAEDKAAALKELKLLLESVAAEDKARALAALKSDLEAAAAKAQAEALASLRSQLEEDFERQLAALRVRIASCAAAATVLSFVSRRPSWRSRRRMLWRACAASSRLPPRRTRRTRSPRCRSSLRCALELRGFHLATPYNRRSLSSRLASSPLSTRTRSSSQSCVPPSSG